MRKRDNMLVVGNDGRRFVATAAIMDPMIAIIDGLPQALFERSVKPYLSVEDAIEWQQKELQHNSGPEEADDQRKCLELLIAWRDAPDDVVDFPGPIKFDNVSKRFVRAEL